MPPRTQSPPRIGRKTLCPCGSGEKFVRCCLPTSVKAGEAAVRRSMEAAGEAVAALPCYECRKPPRSIPVAGYFFAHRDADGDPVLLPLCSRCLKAKVALALTPGAYREAPYPQFTPAKLAVPDAA